MMQLGDPVPRLGTVADVVDIYLTRVLLPTVRAEISGSRSVNKSSPKLDISHIDSNIKVLKYGT